MKKILMSLAAVLTLGHTAIAQYTPVNFDYEKTSFNENLPLPAEKNLMIKGQVSEVISQVRFTIFKNNNHNSPLNVSTWRRSFSNNSQAFDLPINYKLRGGSEYDFQLDYLRRVTDAEKLNLQKALFETLDGYVSSNVEIGRRKVAVSKPAGMLLSDMNDIVMQGLSNYDNLVGYEFKGFSDIIKDKIYQLQATKLRAAKFSIIKSKEGLDNNKESKTAYAQQLIGDLKNMVHSELNQLLNTDLVVIADTKMVQDYPTEKTMNSLPVNIGYGAVYFDGTLSKPNYGTGPYVGLSFPLGNKTFSKFLGNASLSAGIFLQDFKDLNEVKYTGPFIKKPIYAALGYKFFRFIRFNAGVTVVEKRNITIGNLNTITTNDIKILPFIGLSAEINIWAGLKN